MNKKKYLLIGDHRTCENYGSISTSDQLIELMRPRRLTIIPITRMDQDYDFAPLVFSEFDDYAHQVNKGNVLKMEKRAIDNCDCVVINLEGALTHHTNADRVQGKYRARTRYMLFLAYYSAKYCNKEVSIVNHVIDPGNSSAEEMVKNVYPLVKRCWVRDLMSKKNAQNLGINFAEFVPDALFKFEHKEKFLDKRDYICIGDTATLGNANWNIIDFYGDLIARLKNKNKKVIFIDGNMWKTTSILENLCSKLNIKWVHVDNTNWRDLANIFRSSKISFSGRWHSSILATISGTPSVLFGTDSHKTKSLHHDLGIKERFYELDDLPENIDQIYERLSMENQSEAKLFKYAEDQRKLVNKFYSSI